jgi:hypothetical protein
MIYSGIWVRISAECQARKRGSHDPLGQVILARIYPRHQQLNRVTPAQLRKIETSFP